MTPHLLDRFLTILLGSGLALGFCYLAMNFPDPHQIVSHVL